MEVAVHLQWNIDLREQEPINLFQTAVATELLAQTAKISEQTWNSWFQQWLTCLQPNISPIQSYELSLLFTDDAEIQSLNAAYRNLDRPTDVLAFATLDQQDLPMVIGSEMPIELGDIIISIETAALQAVEQQHSLLRELMWLATHGLLHLLGWDHPNEEQLNLMLAQQQHLVELIPHALARNSRVG